jgi:subtilase family serine protease
MSNRKSLASANRLHPRISASCALQKSILERLESRQLLSVAAPLADTFAMATAPLTGAYTPAQLRTAYGVSALGITNQGQGITIGIVDELDDPDITGDANAFSSYYNLPKLDGVGGDPLLTVYKDTTLGSVGSGAGTGVGGETSLDVEWAHSMAPMANIILVEVPATGNVASEFNELLQGVQVAAQMGAESISLSYGTSESSVGASSVVSQNNTYLASGAAASVAVSVATGDASSPSYPATSPNVTAVGGSSLYFASVRGTYSFETAWGGLAAAGAGGGGTSTNFATPAFQSTNGVNFADRATPDVSLVADPVTSVSLYDSLDGGSSPWTSTGGTSVGTPMFAGIIALAQQDRSLAGLAPLSSVQVDQEMYSLYNSPSYSTDFHDITQGSNKNVTSSGRTTVTGYSATTGYDLATGLGSPIANMLVPALSSFGVSPTLTSGSHLRSVTIGGAFAGTVTLTSVTLLSGSAGSTTIELSDVIAGSSIPSPADFNNNVIVSMAGATTLQSSFAMSGSKPASGGSWLNEISSPLADAFDLLVPTL